ncbi:MAG: peroxidase [Candidatus Neomarinimicrobiota bacterium]|nr:peroxidase [Candidatus Neomarinimicrobiota bacterium]
MESHGEDFRGEVADDELADQLKRDWRSAELDEGDRSLCEWAEKLTQSPDKMTRADVEGLQQQGFSQPAISDAAQVISYFNYINRIADGLGVDLEPEMEQESVPAESTEYKE